MTAHRYIVTARVGSRAIPAASFLDKKTIVIICDTTIVTVDSKKDVIS